VRVFSFDNFAFAGKQFFSHITWNNSEQGFALDAAFYNSSG